MEHITVYTNMMGQILTTKLPRRTIQTTQETKKRTSKTGTKDLKQQHAVNKAEARVLGTNIGQVIGRYLQDYDTETKQELTQIYDQTLEARKNSKKYK